MSFNPIWMTLSLVLLCSQPARAESTVPSCKEHEPKVLECISHPEWKGEQGEACSKAEQTYRDCAGFRRTQADKPQDFRDIIAQELAFTQEKLKSYKAALKVCQKKPSPCDPSKLKIIQKMVSGLPKEIAKLKKMP